MEIAPIAVIVFNRPRETRAVFAKLKEAKVPKLYIIMDGPREGNDSDVEMNLEVKRVVDEIDWDCDVKWNVAKQNMGVGPRPYTGIDWVFENEDRAIILEDDCVPALSFFSFASELLERYKDDPRIMHISGTRYNQEFKTNQDSYLFSRYQYNWGWATWRRAWKKYDYHLSNYNEVKEKRYLESRFLPFESKHWKEKFDRAQREKARMWDYQWQYAVFVNSGLCIFPQKNLICNIGPYGSTAPNFNPNLYFRETDENFRIEEHPSIVCVNDKFDRYYFGNHIGKRYSLLQRVIRKIRKKFLTKSYYFRKSQKVIDLKREAYFRTKKQ